MYQILKSMGLMQSEDTDDRIEHLGPSKLVTDHGVFNCTGALINYTDWVGGELAVLHSSSICFSEYSNFAMIVEKEIITVYTTVFFIDEDSVGLLHPLIFPIESHDQEEKYPEELKILVEEDGFVICPVMSAVTDIWNKQEREEDERFLFDVLFTCRILTVEPFHMSKVLDTTRSFRANWTGIKEGDQFAYYSLCAVKPEMNLIYEPEIENPFIEGDYGEDF